MYDNVYPNNRAYQTLVVLVNVNPNAPRFDQSSYTVTVNETEAPGSVIETVLATDPDGVSGIFKGYNVGWI